MKSPKIKLEDGFTMLEVLIVMSVLTVLLSFSVIKLQPIWETMQKKMFITKLQADLYYAHSYAMNRKESVTVSFPRGNNEYQAISSKELLFKRQIPSPIILAATNLNSIVITAEGNVSNFGSMTFQMNDRKITMTFYIGRGRFLSKE